MALDLSSQLTVVRDESTVLERTLEIFIVLFAPKKTIFWVMENGSIVRTLTSPPASSSPPPPPPSREIPAITDTGFLLKIPYKDETIGIVEVEGVAFADHRDHYLSLALSFAGVCGLAIANARIHMRLENALADLRREYDHSSALAGELRVVNESLEERVRERTAELEQTAKNLAEEVKQRKTAEESVRDQLEQKTVLLRELHHRVKNNLQLIMSMSSIQSRKVSDPSLKLALTENRNRIRTMSAIHEKLWSSGDLSRIDLESLIRQIPSNLIALYQVPHGKVSITFDMQKITVDINTAIPLGLVVNELFSNALKHAFPGERKGEVVLSAQEDATGLVLRFADNGVGLPAGYDWQNADSVGLILTRSLVDQLDGTLEREPGSGTVFVIRLKRSSGGSGTVRGTYNELPAR